MHRLNSFLSRALEQGRKGYFVLMHDVLMSLLSFALAVTLALNGDFSKFSPFYIEKQALVFTLIAASVFLFMGLYRSLWRYTSLQDLARIALVATSIIILYIPLNIVMSYDEALPFSFIIINWAALIGLLGASRLVYRLLVQKTDGSQAIPEKKVLLVGTGAQAELFLRHISLQHSSPYTLVGIIADNTFDVGRNIHGVNVVGTADRTADIIRYLADHDQKPDVLVLSETAPNKDMLKFFLSICETFQLTLAKLPKITDLTHNLTHVQIKPIAIEDLLGRPQSTLDQSGMHTLIRGKCVLITGCGGSIGSELVRQIASYAPQKIILIDHSEYLLYCIDQEIGEAFPSLSKVAYIADVGDRARIFELFQKEKPELVFHAAALKHVPIVEENPLEGIETNTLGTKNVADASRHHHVNTMVLISTDKAINPTNIMGATKRLAESYCQSLDVLDTHRTNRTRYVTVRFGNVLGSTGSVVPLFKHQIEQGGPVTVTHPDITRYFMTIREAVALVLQAAAFGSFSAMQGGKIFVLDMGEPVRVVDLAHQMIHLAGLQPNVDIKIEFTGLRPGEKLYEELFHSHESLTPTTIPNLLLGSPRIIDHKDLIHMLEQLTHALQTRHADDAMRLLCAMVPEFVPGDHLGLSA